jgi:hypothetical protein
MSTSTGLPLNLTKPEATDVVSLPVINANYDAINSNASTVAGSLASQQSNINDLNVAVGTGGSVSKAQNIVGGAVKRIPIQSAADTTTFIAAPTAAGQVLISSLTAPYAAWSERGYVQLDQQSLSTSASSQTVSFSSIPNGYQKLVLHIDFTSVTTGPTGTGFFLRVNGISGASTYSYTRNIYGTATPDTSTAATSVLLGNPASSTTPLYVIELPGYSRSNNGKTITASGPALALTGYCASAGAVTSLTVDITSSTAAATLTLYGVK